MLQGYLMVNRITGCLEQTKAEKQTRILLPPELKDVRGPVQKDSVAVVSRSVTGADYLSYYFAAT